MLMSAPYHLAIAVIFIFFSLPISISLPRRVNAVNHEEEGESRRSRKGSITRRIDRDSLFFLSAYTPRCIYIIRGTRKLREIRPQNFCVYADTRRALCLEKSVKE